MQIETKGLREIILVGTLLATIITFFVNIEGWKVHSEDRLDAIEKHVEYDDTRLNRIDDEINVLERRVDYERGRSGVKLDMGGKPPYGARAGRGDRSARAGRLPAQWQGPLTRREVHARQSGD